MVDLTARQERKMSPLVLPALVTASKNSQINKASFSPKKQYHDQKRSLKMSKDSDLVPTSNDNGYSKGKLDLITVTMPLSKKQRIGNRLIEDVTNHEGIRVPDENYDLMMDILQPNTRIEVKWDLIVKRCNVLDKETRWWGATLLPHDGRMHIQSELNEQGEDPVTVPLRVLEYDPYAEGGFHERSRDEVCIRNDHFLYDVVTETHLRFRMEGSSWEDDEDADADDDTVTSACIDSCREEEKQETVESMLQSVVTAFGCSGKMETLSAAQQCFMEAKICLAKESLIEKMLKRIDEEDGGVITADCARQYMQEMETELLSW